MRHSVNLATWVIVLPSHKIERLRAAHRRVAVALWLVCAGSLLAACSETPEERARAAYDSGDFEDARLLAAKLAAQDNIVGLELLTLIHLQGLGGPIDYVQAMDYAERAARVDQSYKSLDRTIRLRIGEAVGASQRAFKREDYERAYDIAEPLARYGHEQSAAIVQMMRDQQYVRLDGSDMSWQFFWQDCSGNTRYDSTDGDRDPFAEKCVGRRAIWDGLVTRVVRNDVYIRMTPGRPRARDDLVLKFDDDKIDRSLASPGKKIRFRGEINTRGNPNEPDTLIHAALIGPAPLTAQEEAAAIARKEETLLRRVMQGCQTLVERQLEASHMPDWALSLPEEIRAVTKRGRNFFVAIGITSKENAFRKLDDGSWTSEFTGYFSVQSSVARMASTADFIAHCEADSSFESNSPFEEHIAVEVVQVSAPRMLQAPAARRGRSTVTR